MPADPTVKQQSYTRATCYILFPPPRVGYPRYSLYVAGRADTILAEDQHHALFTGWFLLLVIEQEARSKLAVRLGLLSTTFPRLTENYMSILYIPPKKWRKWPMDLSSDSLSTGRRS